MKYDIITKKDAKLRGLKEYFTGELCKQGHLSPRLVCNSNCKVCNRENAKEWQKNNKERFAARKKYYAEKHREEQLDYLRTYYRENREKALEYMRQYGQDNKAACYARSLLRKDRIRKATPLWSDLEKISEIYQERDRVILTTGVAHMVDHIIPLRSPLVCGLHVPDNLQIITAEENLRKSNKFTVE